MRLVAIVALLCACRGPRLPPSLPGVPLLFTKHNGQIQPNVTAINAASFQFLLGGKWIVPTLTTNQIHNGVLAKGTFGQDGRIVVARIGTTVTAIAREGAIGFEIVPFIGGHRLLQRSWKPTDPHLPSQLPSLHGPGWDALAAQRGHSPPSPVANVPVTVDVVFAYTPNVAAKRPVDGIWELAEISIADLNDACALAAPKVSFQLDDVVATEDNETGTMTDILWSLRHDKQKFKKAHQARYAANADILALFVDSENGGYGIAPIMAESDNDGFAVAYHAQALWYLTVPHEIGHIFGALHDNDHREDPYKFGHAFVDDKTLHVRTIMSESCALPQNCPLIVRWSAPAANPGDPVYGDKDWSDNAQVIRLSADFISHLGDNLPTPP